MSKNIISEQFHELPRFTWEPGALKRARKKRMRLAWSVWLVAATFVLFQFFLQLSSGEIIAGLMHSFALTAFGGGLLASSYYYVYVLLQTPVGLLLDRYGPRATLSLGAIGVSFGCFIFASAKTIAIALVGRIMMGAGSAFAFVGCLSVISIWFPAKRFAFMAAVVETAGMLGAIFGNFGLAHALQWVGWRACMMSASLFAGVLSIFLVAIVRNTPSKKKLPSINAVSHSLLKSMKKIMSNPIVWLNGIYSGFMFGIVTIFVALWAIPFFEATRHMSLVTATVIASALYLGVAVGGPVIGVLDGRTQIRRKLMIANALLAAICLGLVIFVSSLPVYGVALLLFITGICASSYVLTFAIANEIATPANRAMCIGFTNMLCVIFAPIMQPFVGFLITHLKGVSHGFEWALSIIPISLLFGVVIAFFLPGKGRLK